MKPLVLFILAAVLALLQQPASGQAGEAVRGHASVLTLPAPMAHGRNLRGMPSELSKAAQPSGKPITHVSVVGERHSGTNFMALLLKLNLGEQLNVTDRFCAYKHEYQALSSSCLPLDSTLVVVMLRNPYDWAFAMHRKCWCTFSAGSREAALAMASLDFHTFLTQPWRDDSLKPWSGETNISTCANVMQCRAYKYLNYLNMSRWVPNVEFVRHEDVMTPGSAKRWLSDLVQRYNLPLASEKVQAVKRYKQHWWQQFDPRAAKAKSVWFNKQLTMRNETLRGHVRLITRTMNLVVERMAGYGRRGPGGGRMRRAQDEGRGGQAGAGWLAAAGADQGLAGGQGGEEEVRLVAASAAAATAASAAAAQAVVDAARDPETQVDAAGIAEASAARMKGRAGWAQAVAGGGGNGRFESALLDGALLAVGGAANGGEATQAQAAGRDGGEEPQGERTPASWLSRLWRGWRRLL